MKLWEQVMELERRAESLETRARVYEQWALAREMELDSLARDEPRDQLLREHATYRDENEQLKKQNAELQLKLAGTVEQLLALQKAIG